MLQCFEMQYDLNNEKIISVFKIHYDGTSKEITDYETGETEVITVQIALFQTRNLMKYKIHYKT